MTGLHTFGPTWKRIEDPTTGAERGKIECGSSGLEEEAGDHGYIPKNKGRVGDENFVGRIKYCAGGETRKVG